MYTYGSRWRTESLLSGNCSKVLSERTPELPQFENSGKSKLLDILFEELTGIAIPPDHGSHCGDSGTHAGARFATSLWLVDSAPVLLRALRKARSSGFSVNLLDDAQTLISALTEELSLPADEKLNVIAKLLIKIGVTLDDNCDKTDMQELQPFYRLADDASALSLTGTGFELFVLPWALFVEETEPTLPLDRRISSLRMYLPEQIRSIKISDYELNNWSYYLLLMGRWKSATPMAEVATQMERSPRNLDTLGWAHYFEGNIEYSLKLLTESLKGHNMKTELTFWAQVAYHKLRVLLSEGDTKNANAVLDLMVRNAPREYWTEKAHELTPLCRKNVTSVGDRKKEFDYDIALSFAGEDRDYAKELADGLRDIGIKVFYDEFEKAKLLGKNLYTELVDIYENRARYCVLLISDYYVKNRWTKLEREAAQSRAFSNNEEYLIPIKLSSIDIQKVTGILNTVAYLDWHKEGVEGIIKCLTEKVGLQPSLMFKSRGGKERKQ